MNMFAKDMERRFSSYDFLGYLAPGGMLVLSLLLLETRINKMRSMQVIDGNISLPFFKVYKLITEAHFGDNWLMTAFAGAAALLLIYVVGHIVATISALAIDKVMIAKGYGYPYEKILKIHEDDEESFSRKFYSGSFFWINVSILCYYTITIRVASVDNVEALDIVYFLSMLYFIITLIFKLVLGFKWIDGSLIINKLENYKKAKHAIERYFYFYSIPSDSISRFFAKYLRSNRQMEDEIINDYGKFIRRNFGLDYKLLHTDNYWLSYLYIRDNNPQVCALADNWQRLYSFARNVSTGFYLCYIYSIIWFIYHEDNVLHFQDRMMIHTSYITFSFFICSLLMLARFRYLYVDYYSRFIFRSFYYINKFK